MKSTRAKLHYFALQIDCKFTAQTCNTNHREYIYIIGIIWLDIKQETQKQWRTKTPAMYNAREHHERATFISTLSPSLCLSVT